MRISPYFENVDVDKKRKTVLVTLVLTILGILNSMGQSGVPVNFNATFFNIQGIRWGYAFIIFLALSFLWIQNKPKGGV